MSHRQMTAEIGGVEFAEWMAFYMVEAEPTPKDAEETLRAELAAKAVAGVRARKAKRRRR